MIWQSCKTNETSAAKPIEPVTITLDGNVDELYTAAEMAGTYRIIGDTKFPGFSQPAEKVVKITNLGPGRIGVEYGWINQKQDFQEGKETGLWTFQDAARNYTLTLKWMPPAHEESVLYVTERYNGGATKWQAGLE